MSEISFSNSDCENELLNQHQKLNIYLYQILSQNYNNLESLCQRLLNLSFTDQMINDIIQNMKRSIKNGLASVIKNYGYLEYSKILDICNDFEKTQIQNKKDMFFDKQINQENYDRSLKTNEKQNTQNVQTSNLKTEKFQNQIENIKTQREELQMNSGIQQNLKLTQKLEDLNQENIKNSQSDEQEDEFRKKLLTKCITYQDVQDQLVQEDDEFEQRKNSTKQIMLKISRAQSKDLGVLKEVVSEEENSKSDATHSSKQIFTFQNTITQDSNFIDIYDFKDPSPNSKDQKQISKLSFIKQFKTEFNKTQQKPKKLFTCSMMGASSKRKKKQIQRKKTFERSNKIKAIQVFDVDRDYQKNSQKQTKKSKEKSLKKFTVQKFNRNFLSPERICTYNKRNKSLSKSLKKIIKTNTETKARKKIKGCNSTKLPFSFLLQKPQANLLKIQKSCNRKLKKSGHKKSLSPKFGSFKIN